MEGDVVLPHELHIDGVVGTLGEQPPDNREIPRSAAAGLATEGIPHSQWPTLRACPPALAGEKQVSTQLRGAPPGFMPLITGSNHR
jgi:hypothetical protein